MSLDLTASSRADSSGRTAFQVLLDAAQEAPDRPVVTFLGDRAYTRRQLADAATLVAGALQQRGVERGDRVVIMLGNRFEFLSIWLGATAIGAVVVPVNTAMRGNVLEHMLSLTEPSIVFAGTELADELLSAPTASRLQEQIIWIGDSHDHRGVRFEGFVEKSAPVQELDGVQMSELASILFTSGTTGPSKGVMWSHQTASSMADGALFVMDYQPDDVVYTCLPLFHSNALFTTFLAALMRRAQVVVASRFSASTFWQQVLDSGATTISLLGAMVPILRKQIPSPLDTAHRVRLALVVPLDAADHASFRERFGIECTSLYGLTDVGTPIGVPAGRSRPGSCGVVVPGWECVLADSQDHPVPDGQPGELLVRPLRPFMGQLGYWRMPEQTLTAWRNLWYHTGDLMQRDAEGWFQFLDRSKDAIRRSGENISSYEVEQALLEHPSVQEVAAYAVPSDLSEDEVMVSVVVQGDRVPTELELVEWCAERLPYFAVPRFVQLVERLPRTTTLKVQKESLRAIGVTARTYDRGPGGRKAQRVPVSGSVRSEPRDQHRGEVS